MNAHKYGWIAAGLLLAGCPNSEPQIRDLLPIMSVQPEVLDLGEEDPVYTKTGLIYITNDGLDKLEVTPTLEGPDVFSLDINELFIIPREESAALTVSFQPKTYQEYQGRVILQSNDEEHPTWVVPIRGKGIEKPKPDIEITPARTIETFLPQGTFSTFLVFNIENVGAAPLQIDNLTLEGATEFTTQLVPSPGTLLPAGEATQVVVEYATPTTDGHNATVTIHTNDPDEPEMTVLLLGNGGGDYEKPEAVIDCPGSVGLAGPEWVGLSGAQSTDPAGAYPLEYEWEVTYYPPASSKEKLDPDNTPEVDLYVDVAGTWEVSLVVINQLGTRSEPELCQFVSYPEDNIHVELSWDTAQADLDLHLTQGGSAMFDVPEDCNWCNMSPNWGSSGDADDPRLDIDDLGGYGPENINLYQPEDGTYDLRVHYFAPRGDGAVVATVKVWLEGVEIFSESQAMTHKDVWYVGQIEWDDTPDLYPPPDEERITRATVARCQTTD